MIVVVQEQLQRAHTGGRRVWPHDAEALVVNRLDEAFHLPVRFRTPRPNEPMFNARALQRLLEPRPPIRVKGIPHREHHVVVGHHGLDAIRQLRQHMFEKPRGRDGAAFARDRREPFTTEVIDRRILKFRPGSERRQVFQIQMQQLPGPALLIALDGPARGPRQSIPPQAFERPLHGAVPDAELLGNPLDAPAKVPGPGNRIPDGRRMARGRPMRPPTPRLQTRQVLGLVPRPPARQHRPRNPMPLAQDRQRHTRFVLRHQLRSQHRIMRYTPHAPPPGGSS